LLSSLCTFATTNGFHYDGISPCCHGTMMEPESWLVLVRSY